MIPVPFEAPAFDEPVDQSSFDARNGFLSASDPLDSLGPEFRALDELGAAMPAALVEDRFRALVSEFPKLDVSLLDSQPEKQRAMLLYSFAGQAYIWSGSAPLNTIPPQLAVPWARLAQDLGRKPILSYPSSVLANWRRRDRRFALTLDNIEPQMTFLGSSHERWFFSLHVAVEASAAPILRSISESLRLSEEERIESARIHLLEVSRALRSMVKLMQALPENTDPHFYFRKVRPFLHGWKDNAALPNGVIYQGVDMFEGRPQHFRGETAAQSVIIPAVDAFLGVDHQEDPLRVYLREMRDYMEPAQRRFLLLVESKPSMRRLLRRGPTAMSAIESFNECIDALRDFRARHFGLTMRYIVGPSSALRQENGASQSSVNSDAHGTAGTPFLDYLKKHLDETIASEI